MSANRKPSRIGRAWRGAWWLLDASRRLLLNLLMLLLLVALAWLLLRGVLGGPAALQPKTTLVLELSGRLVEQRSGSLRDNAVRTLRGQQDVQTRLRDVVTVLDAAARDPAITQALLLVDGLNAAGLPKLREVAAALQRFKAAGKTVVAWGSHYDQRQYYLAAQASTVWLHPMGLVDVKGYGTNRSYYKDLLDTLGVQANVFRVGRFKSANEGLAASGPSPETLEAEGALADALWGTWTRDVEGARKLPAGSVAQAIAGLPDSLLALAGDSGRWAVQTRWVDALKTRDELRAALVQSGAAQDDGKTFRQVHWADYLARIAEPDHSADAVGVVVAEGSIVNGNAGPGGVGGLSTSALIRQAREDDKVKAVVLRVDSPGGSAFGSELVRRELELTRQAGKPVVVSMGDVAASGGYWISLAADELLADEATVTGSIGVVSMLPTAQAALDRLGVHTDGVATTWLARGYDPRRGIEPRFAQLVQARMQHVYTRFTGFAAAARKTTPERIDAVGQGRVWAGKQALQHGLVDRLGGLRDAVASAAGRAKLRPDYRVQYIEAQPGRLQQLLQGVGVSLPAGWGLDASAATTLPATTAANASDSLLLALSLGLGTPVTREMLDDLAWLTDFTRSGQAFDALAHCLCRPPE